MIRSLAYLGFRSPNAAEWATFGPEILGAQNVPDGPGGEIRLRIDSAAWRLAIHRAENDDLAYIGWDVGDAGGLAETTARLSDAGIDVEAGDAELADARGVDAVSVFTDPLGFRHELIHGQHAADDPFAAGRPMEGGFVTGTGGLGHLVLMVPDLDAQTAFLVGVLGFRHSDDIGVGLRFFHCNPRHHTLAVAEVPGMVGVHHLMLEVEHPDDVGRAYDLVNERGLPVAMSLGRHTNDEMFSFYVRSPSGFEVEYGSGGRLIDTTAPWEPDRYDSGSVWGHRAPATALRPAILRPIDA